MADQPNVFWDDIAKTFVTGQVGAANSGTAITGGGGSADQAWQFRPETFNAAAGDGKIATDVAVNSTQTITSVQMAANAVVGQWVMINGGRGTSDTAAVGQITAITKASNSITLSSPTLQGGASLPINFTTTGLNAVYGTDSVAAINSALTAAKTYAEANNYYAELLLKDKIYVAAAAPTQTNGSPAVVNTQILIPYPTSNTNRKLHIGIIGAGNSTNFQYWQSSVPNIQGSAIVSMQTAPSTLDATFGVQSVIGAPSGDAGFAGSFVNVKAIIKNVSVWCPVYTHMTGIDLTWLGGAEVKASCHVFAQATQGTGVLLTNIFADGVVFGSRLGVGIRFPAIGNNADVWVPSLAVEGYTIGLMASEHVRMGDLKTIYTAVALKTDTGQGLNNQGHGVVIEGWTAEAFQGALLCVGTGICHVDIRIVTEGTAATYDISDTNNTLRGVIHWFDPVESVTTRFPLVTGGASLRVINETMPPGAWAGAPAVPASTTAVAQSAMPHRDAGVTVAGGTVTAITVDGVATGITAGTVFVPSGKTIAVTYSVAPTWKWVLL